MNELTQHIKVLLLQHSCVIVPEFGGFVTRYVSAHYDEESHTYIPPARVVAFNSSLTADDGLLAQSYMQTYRDMNYNEATRRIAEAVKIAKGLLNEGNTLELDGIGKISMTPSGQHDFTADELGIFDPNLYGLTPLQIKKRTAAQTNISNRQEENETKERKTYTLRLNRELVNYVATAAIAVLFYFIWSSPVTDTQNSTAPQPAYSAFRPALPPSQETAKSENAESQLSESPLKETREKNEETTQTTPAENTVAPETAGRYTIVLVSRVSKKNAESFAAKLKKEGLDETSVYVKGKMVRVIYGNYAEEAAAYQAMNQLRNEVPEFSDAWVLELK